MTKALHSLVVVDDNPLLLAVLSTIFTEQGYVVRVATDGFSALCAIREQIPDILLSDLNMPDMSGFELLSVVRRRFPGIAVIAMSGAFSGSNVPLGVAADGFYAKGKSGIDHLLDLVGAMSRSGTLQELRTAAPIWLPGLPVQSCGAQALPVVCPECLRVSSHRLVKAEFEQHHAFCPHCSQSLTFGVVSPTYCLDGTVPAARQTTSPSVATAIARREDKSSHVPQIDEHGQCTCGQRTLP